MGDQVVTERFLKDGKFVPVGTVLADDDASAESSSTAPTDGVATDTSDLIDTGNTGGSLTMSDVERDAARKRVADAEEKLGKARGDKAKAEAQAELDAAKEAVETPSES